MNPAVLYIQPAMTDIAGQCRIYWVPESQREPRLQTQKERDSWREVGIMASDGHLVCMDYRYQNVITRADEPLMAGTVWTLEDERHWCGERVQPDHPRDCYYCRHAIDNAAKRRQEA